MTTHTLRGLGAMRLPTRAQKPVLVGSGDPNVGRLGQKIQRPQITSRAGSRVTITRKVTAMPTARTGPMPGGGVELGEAQAQHADHDRRRAGQDAGAARCSAKAIASWRSSWRRSSSRYRATSSRA